MGEVLGNFSSFLFKVFLADSQDVRSKSERHPVIPDVLNFVWVQFSNSSITIQAVIVLILISVAYRCILVPFAQDFFVAENCHLKLENPEPLKAGDNMIFTVSGFLPHTRPENNEEIDECTRNFFNVLTVKVHFNDERIPVMKAYAEEDYGKIKVVFTAEKSGNYIMVLRYNGFLLPECPYNVSIPPDSMSAEATEVKLPSMPVILTDGMPQRIRIHPKDRTAFPCSAEGVRLDKFDFHASTERSCCNARLCGKTCELVGGYWKEGLDASFTYGGRPGFYDQNGSELTVLLTLRTNRSPNSHGIFEGQICYDGEIVECFPVVSLSLEEYERLEPTLKVPKPTDVIQLKGEILQPVCETMTDNWYTLGKPAGVTDHVKEVHLNISMKFICIKEVVWTVLLSRTALFSIQGGTKIEAIPETDDKEKYAVTISDESGNEVRVRMLASCTRMLLAIFLKFRANSTNTENSFLEKSNDFFESLNIHCKKIMSFHKENFQVLNVWRPDILRTSYEETQKFEKEHWYNPFLVSFIQEPLLEGPSAWLEWSELIFDTVFENNPNGMFCKISEISGFIHPNPSRNFRRWSIQYYELVGKLLGKYLVERALNPHFSNFHLKLRFSRSFLLQLIGSTPIANSLERDMPEVYEATVKSLTKSNFDDGALTFCVPVYDAFARLEQMIPLIENGENILVTNDNADQYLSALARYNLCQKVKREVAAFRSGFTFTIPEDLLLNFDENELELLICGWSKLEISDIKKHHIIVGENWHPEFTRVLKWFWGALDGMSSLDHARFLQFCTGSSILPLGGFSALNPKLSLSMTCLYGQLPVSDPSAHSICFSDHPDFESFGTSLLTAVRRSACCQDRPNRLECIHQDEMNQRSATSCENNIEFCD